MLRNVTLAQEQWQGRVGEPRVPMMRSVFPDHAVAVIYKPSRSAMTSGKARTREWKLRFEPRSPRYIEPLMGWTGNDDTLARIVLTFPSAEAAVAYARRQGLNYVVRGLAGVGADVRRMGDDKPAGDANSRSGARPRRSEWIERARGIRKEAQEANDPSARYAAPRDVLRDPALSEVEKRNVLQRWAFDAYLIELALSKGHDVPHPSRLDEVIDALIDLDEAEVRRIAARAPCSVCDARRSAA
jgi:ETC complex I subunit conserved region